MKDYLKIHCLKEHYVEALHDGKNNSWIRLLMLVFRAK